MGIKVRCALALATAFVVSGSLSACASSARGGGAGAGGETETEVSSPSVEELPRGTEPSDNLHTRSAALYLSQAQQNTIPEEKRQRFREALEASFNSVGLEPGNPKGYFQAGQAYIGLGDLAGADSMFTKAEEIYPRYLDETRRFREQQWVRMYNQGINRLQGGDAEASIEFFQRANMIYDRRPEAMLNLAAAHAQRGEVEQAVEAYRDALELMRSDIIEQQDAETQERWRDNVEVAAFNMAQLLAQAGQNQEAARAYEDFLDDNPGHVIALSNLALVLNNMEMQDSARVIYDELLTRTDLASREYFNIGIGLFQSESYVRASDAFRRSAELVPGNRDAIYNLVQTLFLAENYEELLEPGERLVEELDPYNPNAYNLYIQALVQTGQEDLGLEYQDRRDALPFHVTGAQLQPIMQGGGRVSGEITNQTLEPGTPITIVFHFVGDDGQEIGTTEETLEAPAPEASIGFRTELDAESPALGFWYEVTAP